MRASLLLFSTSLMVLLAGCPAENLPDADAGSDAAVDAARGPCTSDADCSNGIFCDGTEDCDPGGDGADARGCAPRTPPCPAASCDEDADRCEGGCTVSDADGDGDPAIACGGTDCDDTNERRAPSRTEVCDAADLDEDCDSTTFGFRDIDMDGEIDAACCNGEGAEAVCGEDCDDTRSGVSPVAPEVCNGRDDDCNGAIDEGVLLTFYVDVDRDQFGVDTEPTIEACAAPVGYAEDPGDCNDAESGVNPGVMERCDAARVDENCDGIMNPDSLCMCTDGASRNCTLPGVCATGQEICAGGGWGPCSITPVSETCNGLDDDCDGAIDDGVTITCYADNDNDTYAPVGSVPVARCSSPSRPTVGGCPAGFTNRAPGSTPDCNDTSDTTNPGAAEICDSLDSNCSSGGGVTIDEDADGDLHSPTTATCSGGFPRDDCNDAAPSAYLGAPELCDRIDNDCSSGGGTLTTEDNDMDAHAPIGAACSGGFPVDDCVDVNASVHPGQALYFATPYCASGSPPESCPGYSGLWCNGCPPGCGGCETPVLATYDYDCSGSSTRAPVAACPSSGMPLCAAAPCRSGPAGTTAACGNNTTWILCTCDGIRCNMGGTGVQPMTCH